MYAPLTFEALTIAYFAALAVAARWTQAPAETRRLTTVLFVGIAAAIAAASYVLPVGARFWLGHAYLVAGYRLPALLVRQNTIVESRITDPGPFESWLVRMDARWFRLGSQVVPNWAAYLFELSYLFCYALVPAAFLFIWTRASAAVVDRFWTAVLLGGFACYGLLPWLVSIPPRARRMESAAASTLRRLNVEILSRASHGLNTFPSGHVAVSVAAALSVLVVSWSAGLLALAIASAVAAGAVAGRYHYAVDVAAGYIVGVSGWILAMQ